MFGFSIDFKHHSTNLISALSNAVGVKELHKIFPLYINYCCSVLQGIRQGW